MGDKYKIHDDFKKLPVLSVQFKPWIIALLNTAVKADRRVRCLRVSQPVSRETHRLYSSDGVAFDVITIKPNRATDRLPVLLYFHGGAFAMTYATSHLQFCERYAYEANCAVVFVDYRLGPKYPFPAGFNDCYQSLQWLLSHEATEGFDTQRVIVGGDSAGGALAAGVAQKANDEDLTLAGQLLIYPVADHKCSTDSAQQFDDVPVWNAVSNQRMWDMYLGAQRDTPPKYAVPGQGESLQGLPMAYIETAEFDPLRDEGLEYAEQLHASGVVVTRNETQGTVHGFDVNTKSAITEGALTARIGFLRQVFNA